MTTELGYAVRLAILVTLLGLWRRGHLPHCIFFAAYLVAVAALEQVQAWWPERFYTFAWYLRFQALFNALKFAIGIELAVRVFRAFPGATARMRLLLVAILTATTYAVLGGPLDVDLKHTVFVWEPRIQAGTIWLMTAVALLVVWYRLPIEWIQKAILLGFLPYLTVFGTLMSVLRKLDRADGMPLALYNAVNGGAYLATCLFWAYAAWRPREGALRAGVLRAGHEEHSSKEAA